MLKRVTNELKDTMFQYVKQEPAVNLFIIGDVEQFGLDVDFQEVYLQYEDDDITACVIRYYHNVVVYSDRENFNVLEIIDLILSFDYKRISGKTSVLDQLLPYLPKPKEIDLSYLCKLKNADTLVDIKETVHQARVEDLDNMIPLLQSVGFYSSTFKESNTRKIETKAGRMYFIKKDDKVVASAGTAIETSVSAMIGAVATLEDYRNKGLASQIVSKISRDLLKENKTPCLFFHNPVAGRIYHRLGFQDIGKWTMTIYD